MKRTLVLLLVICMLLGTAPSRAWATQEYDEAMALLMQDRYEEAAEAFAAAGNEGDAPMMAMYCAAVAAGERGEYSLAVSNLRSLIGFRDALLLAQYYYARSYEAEEEYEKAAGQLEGLEYYRDVSARLSEYPEKINARDYRKAEETEKAGMLENAYSAFVALGSYKDSAERALKVREKIKARDYAAAEALEDAGKLEKAYDAFVALGSYKDSAERAEAVREKIKARDYAAAEALEEADELEKAYDAFAALKDYKDSAERALTVLEKIKARDYAAADAMEQAGELENAYDAFSALGSYKDSAERAQTVREKIKERDYAAADAMEQAGDYAAALAAFRALGNYRDSAERASILFYKEGYARAVQLSQNGDFAQAYTLFASLGDYEDSEDKAYILSVSQFAEQMKLLGRGMAAFKVQETWGVIDLDDNDISSPYWDVIGVFNEYDLAKVGHGGLYGYADRNGTEVIPAQYAGVSDFMDGLAVVAVKDGNNYLYGLRDTAGREITPAQWRALGGSVNSDWGNWRNNMNIRRPEFTDGRIIVRDKSGKLGLMAQNGRILGSVRWDEIGEFRNGLAVVCSDDKYGLIGTDGRLVGNVEWDEIKSFSEGMAVVQKNDRYGYIGSDGLVKIKPVYEDALPFSQGLAAVKTNGLYQYIDQDGGVVIRPMYSRALSFSGDRAYVYVDGTGWQVIDHEGTQIYFINNDMRTVYARAESLMAQGEYAEAYALYDSLAGYQDANEKMGQALDGASARIHKKYADGDYAGALEDIRFIEENSGAEDMILMARYAEGEVRRAMEDWDAAIGIFTSLGVYADAAEQVSAAYYAKGEALRAAEDWAGAEAAFEKAGGYLDSAQKKTQSAADGLFAEKQYDKAWELYSTLPDEYRTSGDRYLAIYEDAVRLRENGEFGEAIDLFTALGGYGDAADQIPATRYAEGVAKRDAADWEGAVEIFASLGGYGDAAEQILATRYLEGVAKRKAKDWEGALTAFEQAKNYQGVASQIKATRYQQAKAMKDAGQYAAAYDIFAELEGYKDVDEIMQDEAFLAAAFDARYSAGSYVTFGSYPQTENGDVLPIEWLVLKRDGSKVLLISRYGLDAAPYNTKKKDITWENCTLRKWLNGDFMKTAFTKEEQKAILKTAVDNGKGQGYSAYKTRGGNNTKDQLFLMSYAEVNEYFPKWDARKCVPTDYAVKQGVSAKADGKGTCRWWMRSPGASLTSACCVLIDGACSPYTVNIGENAVRPAMWINLDSVAH